MSVVDLVRWQAIQAGANPALSIPGHRPDVISYLRLWTFVENAASRLAAGGFDRGGVVGLRLQDSLLHIVFTLALERLGVATVALPLSEIPKALQLQAIIAGPNAPRTDWPTFQVDMEWLVDSGKPAPKYKSYNPDHLCRILLTSGSTGQPKAIGLTHAMIELRLRSYGHVFGPIFPKQDRMLCCMGLASSIGYLFMLYMLQRGGMFCVPDPSIDLTHRKAALYDVGCLVAPSSTLAEFWAFSEAEKKGFPSLKLILTAGSLLPTALAEQIRRNVCSELVTFYGTTETGVVAAAQAEVLDLSKGEVGFVVPGMNVEVLDLVDGSRTVEGAGRIRISSPANASGYIGENDEASSFFDGGCFYPGDIGLMGDDDALSIKGRERSVINLGGHKTTIEIVEDAFSNVPEIIEAAVVLEQDALGLDRVVAIVVPTLNWSEPSFWTYCYKNVERAYWPIRLVSAGSLPRLPNGKLDRIALHGLV